MSIVMVWSQRNIAYMASIFRVNTVNSVNRGQLSRCGAMR